MNCININKDIKVYRIKAEANDFDHFLHGKIYLNDTVLRANNLSFCMTNLTLKFQLWTTDSEIVTHRMSLQACNGLKRIFFQIFFSIEKIGLRFLN